MAQRMILTFMIIIGATSALVLSEKCRDKRGNICFSNGIRIKRDAERIKRVAITSLLLKGFKYGTRLRMILEIQRARSVLLADAKIVDRGKNVETYVKIGGKDRAHSDFILIGPRDVRVSGSLVYKAEGVVGDSTVELLHWDVGRNVPGYTIIMSNKKTFSNVIYRDK